MSSKPVSIRHWQPTRRGLLKLAGIGMGTWGATNMFRGPRAFAAGASSRPSVKFDYLPKTKQQSTDPALPGTWHVLDRRRPIAKTVDRPSLVPVKDRSVVMFRKTKLRAYEGPAKRYASLVTLPCDVGDEQVLLGCLPTVRGRDGTLVPSDLNFCRSAQEGNLHAEVVVDDCPAEFSLSLTFVLLLAPVLSTASKQEATRLIAAMTPAAASRRLHQGTSGFPVPEFIQGGPGFIDVTPGRTPLETVDRVLQKVRADVEDSLNPEYSTFTFTDPDMIKKIGRGGCVQRARLAEKALAGVAPAVYAASFRDGIDPAALARYPGDHRYPGIGHAVVLVADPASGDYFFGDPSAAIPYMGPHPGDIIVERTLERFDHQLVVPSGVPWPIDRRRMLIDLDYSDRRQLQSGQVTYSGSSRYGDDADKYRQLLDRCPAEFRRIADETNRRHSRGRRRAG